jgi:hypothetical protein
MGLLGHSQQPTAKVIWCPNTLLKYCNLRRISRLLYPRAVSILQVRNAFSPLKMASLSTSSPEVDSGAAPAVGTGSKHTEMGLTMSANEENDLKRKLGIESWKNLSKDKFLTFVSEMPNMSKEVTLKIIDQFPDFKSLVLDSLGQVEEQAANALAANWKSQKKVHKAFAEQREMLRRELDREGLTSEDRFSILRMFAESVEKEAAKDSEHKIFSYKLVTTVAGIAVGGVAAGLAILGGKSKISDEESA